jgi:hypothetical protein
MVRCVRVSCLEIEGDTNTLSNKCCRRSPVAVTGHAAKHGVLATNSEAFA